MKFDTKRTFVGLDGKGLRNSAAEDDLSLATFGDVLLNILLAEPKEKATKAQLFTLARRTSEAHYGVGDHTLELSTDDAVSIKGQAEAYLPTLAYGLLCEVLEDGGISNVKAIEEAT